MCGVLGSALPRALWGFMGSALRPSEGPRVTLCQYATLGAELHVGDRVVGVWGAGDDLKRPKPESS